MSRRKLEIYRIHNAGRYNELDVEKSQSFLDHLQDFVVAAGFDTLSKGKYVLGQQPHDPTTFDAFIVEDNSQVRSKVIDEFNVGEVIRYVADAAELLVIFLPKTVKLIFYCDSERRKQIMESLRQFCEVRRRGRKSTQRPEKDTKKGEAR